MISNVISFLEKGKEKKEKNNKAEKVEKNTVRLLIRVEGKLVGSGRVTCRVSKESSKAKFG